MLNFLDNFIAPLELPGGQEEVQTSLDLPDGEYILTMANNTASPTRYEVVFAWSEDGITWIWRDPGMGLAEWPEGSVIFCGINSHVLQEIFYQLEDFSYQLEDVSHQLSSYRETWAGGGTTLSANVGLVTVLVSAGLTELYADNEQPYNSVVEHTIMADMWPSGTLRISGGGRQIARARLQQHPYLSFTADPDGEYVDITTSTHAELRIRVQTEVILPDEDEVLDLLVTVEDLSEGFAVVGGGAF